MIYIKGHLESKNIVNNNIISISFFSCVHITYWNLTIFQVLIHLQRLFVQYVPFQRLFCFICVFSRVIDLSILDRSVIFMPSSRVSSFPCILLFWEVTSFEPISLPCFKCILDIHLLTVLHGHQSVLEYLQSGYVTLSLSLYQWMCFVIGLQVNDPLNF